MKTKKGAVKGGGARVLAAGRRDELLGVLRGRFEGNMGRHGGMDWGRVLARLEGRPEGLWTLGEMERTGGEPDVVGLDGDTGEFVFYDCAAESPAGRRSVCYDREGLESRREHAPENNAMDMAAEMGIEMLTEEEYRGLQRLGIFDAKSSS